MIDPGQAFGTGAHATTRLCLELLLALEPSGPLVDLGCGSGVLAIAAAKLGWGPVLGVDHDPLAVEATRENARVNGVDIDGPPPRPPPRRPGRRPPRRCSPTCSARSCGGVAADGFAGPAPRALIASGLLVAEADEIAAAFAAHGLAEAGRRTEGEWAALLLASAGSRPPGGAPRAPGRFAGPWPGVS